MLKRSVLTAAKEGEARVLLGPARIRTVGELADHVQPSLPLSEPFVAWRLLL